MKRLSALELVLLCSISMAVLYVCSPNVFGRSAQLHTDYSNPESIRIEFENIFKNMQQRCLVVDSTPTLEDCEEGNFYVVYSTGAGSANLFTRVGDKRIYWPGTEF